MLAAMSLLRAGYSWNHLGASPMTAAISSIVTDDTVLSVNGIPSAAAARAGARSPSECMMPCTPIGARRNGAAVFVPRTSVEISRTATSLSTRCFSLTLSKAARLARMVSPLPAPPAMYQYAFSGSVDFAAVSQSSNENGSSILFPATADP